MEPIETARLAFDPASLHVLNAVLGIVMFGVALDMHWSDFRRVLTAGRAVTIGLVSMTLVLPALTFGLVWLLDPAPAVALGLILVAACPGGTISNVLTHHARGDVALSVTMTSVSTAASFLVTPANLAFWGELHPASRTLLREISVSPIELASTVMLTLGLPLILGMSIAARWPAVAERMRKPMKRFSMVVFALMIALAVGANYKAFLPYVGGIAGLVLVQNSCGLAIGYFAARAFGLIEADRRAISLEVGMHNTGLGLILIFNHFEGNGGMAIIAAWWGVWHLISGLALATWWRGRPLPS